MIQTELPEGKGIAVLIAGLEIARKDDGLVRVYLPSGEVYEVSEDLVRSAEAPNSVPVQP
jgi:hypothetical protein